MRTHVILGDGAAGMSAARAIRTRSATDRVVVVSDDPQPFYYRAALTNYLLGESREDELWALPQRDWTTLRIERVADRAIALDPAKQTVTLHAGGALPYDTLLIATGARARRLPVLDETLPGVFTFRTLRDAQQIVERAAKARRAVVVGGGILGLEAAQGLHARGVRVTVVHRNAWLLERMLDRVGGELVRGQMKRDGVDALFREEVAEVVRGRKGLKAVRLTGGTTLPCDLLVACVGIEPNTAWLEGSGIETRRGALRVNRRMEVAGAPHVFAAGDLTHFVDEHLPFANTGGLWQPAVKQGIVAGSNMADPRPDDQYRPGAIYNATRAWDLDVATLGDHVDGRGDLITYRPPGTRTVIKKALLRHGRLRGVALLGDRREGRALQRIMNLRGEAANVSTIADRLFDPNFDLFAWVAAQERAPGVRRHNLEVGGPIGALPAAQVNAPTFVRNDLAMAQEGETALLTSARPGAISLTVDDTTRAFVGPDVHVGTTPGADLRLTGDTPWAIHLRLEGVVWMLRSSGEQAAWITCNGRPVARCAPLERGDVLQVGPHRILVDFDIARQQAPPPPAEERSAWLLDGHTRHGLTQRCTTLGASSQCDIVVADRLVSRSHAQVLREGTPPAYYLVDAGSANGTTVNGTRLQASHRLRPGDTIGMGSSVFEYREVDEAVRRGPDAPTQAVVQTPAAYLVARQGPLRGQSVPVPNRGTLGRGRMADVRVQDPLLSRVHLAFHVHDDGMDVEDRGSENGTVVNGTRVPAGDTVRVRMGQTLRVGRHHFVLRKHPATPHVYAPGEGDPAADAATVQLASHHFRLEQRQEGVSCAFPLQGALVTIGRSEANDIALAKKDVSRDHCRLEQTDDGYAIADVGSRFGTLVNGERLAPDEPRALRDGDVVQLGERAVFDFRKVKGREGPLALAPQNEWPEATLQPLRPALASQMPGGRLSGAGPWVLGRQASRSAVPVPFDTVSRTHCVIRREGLGFVVENLSTLGTGVNGEDIPEKGHAPLDDGDVLTLQDIDLRFRSDAPQAPTPRAADRADAFPDDGIRSDNPLAPHLEAAVRQELDGCIGCHACMRACPLPDADDVTIAALNAHAGGLGTPTDLVHRFVASCTQCHACVPVCPADIRRSRLVLWNKLKRVPKPEDPVALQVGTEQSTGTLTLGDVARSLATHEVFGALDPPARLALLGTARFRQLARGEELVREGEYPDALWVVLSGEVALGMAAVGRSFLTMTTLGAGQTVAEVALLANQPIAHGVRATQVSLVVGFSNYALKTARADAPGFDARLDALYLTSATARTLQRLDLHDDARAALRDALTPERFAMERVIMRRTEAAQTIGIVHRGFVREVRRRGATERVANYLKPGDVFGGEDDDTAGDVLLRYEAATHAEVFTLHKERVRALDERFQGVARALLPASRPREGGRTGLALEADLGMLQATQLLAIDTRLCVDCDNCVSACERRHGTARLERQNSGLQQGPFQVPASCYHCVDPLCLFCAVDGIVRDPGGEIRIAEDRCIGCGACAQRCPYDNIFLRPRAKGRPPLLRRLLPRSVQRVLRIEGGKATVDYEQVAVKCDLCAGYRNGPACVRSCPVGAAVRADPAALFGVGRGA